MMTAVVGALLALLAVPVVRGGGDWSGLRDRVSLGLFPTGSVVPVSLAVFALNGVATPFASFEGWSAREAISGFMLTSGLGITEETRSKVKEFEPAIKEYLSRSRESASLTPITLDEDSIAVPVVLAGEYHLLQCSRFDDFRQVSREFLSQRAPRFLSGVVEGPSESTNVTELFAAQLSVRARMLAKQHEAFADDGQGATREQPTCPREIFAPLPKSTTTSHLLTRHYVENATFPTFVVNLWWNAPRRALMQRQLARSGLLGNAYLALGPDALSLTQYVLKIGLDKNSSMVEGHLACGFAHAQVMQEVMRSNLPFAVVLEDDVELSPDITCALSQALLSPDLPPDWDIIFLEPQYSHPVSGHDNDTTSGCSEYGCSDYSKACLFAWRSAPTGTLLKLDRLCAGFTSIAYILSHKGATTIYEAVFPIREPVDVAMGKAIEQGIVQGFYMVPIRGHFPARRHEASTHANTSQINFGNPRTLAFDADGKTVVHTRDPRIEGERNCSDDLCILVFDPREY